VAHTRAEVRQLYPCGDGAPLRAAADDLRPSTAESSATPDAPEGELPPPASLSDAELAAYLASLAPGDDGYGEAMREKARRVLAAEAAPAAPASSGGWPEPIPLDAPPPDPLPLDTLPPWMRAHVASVADFVQVPADLPALLALVAVAGAVQKKYEVEARPGWTEPVTLWGAGVLEASARKSPTFRQVMAPVQEYERRAADAVEADRTAALDRREILEARLEEAKKRAVKAGADERVAAEAEVAAARDDLEAHHVPTAPTLWVDDVNDVSLLSALNANHGRLINVSPEGDLFKFMAGRDGKGATVLNVFKKSWTGGEHARDTRVTREDNDVPNPALSVGICVQPQVLEDLAQKRTFRGEGLLARFLYVVPSSRAGYRKTGRHVPPLDAAAKARYEGRLTALLDAEPLDKTDRDYVPHRLRLAEAARPVLWAFEEEVEAMLRPGGDLEGLEDWGGKLVGQMLRLAGVLHVASADGPPPGSIGAKTVGQAVRLARAFIPHAHAAHDLLGAREGVRLARYVWKRLREKTDTPKSYPQKYQKGEDNGQASISGDCGDAFRGVSSLTRRDLWQATKGKTEVTTVDDLDAPLALLARHHLIREVQPKSTGRGRPPSPVIYLNPHASRHPLTPTPDP
jgi:hypothetical protein